MNSLTACTRNQVTHFINELVIAKGYKVEDVAPLFLSVQLGAFIDDYISSSNTTATVDRNLSQALCAFLFELNKAGTAHYSDIRNIVLAKYQKMTNDYSSLQLWGLIQKSEKANGYWKVTDKGKAFLAGKIKIAEKLTIKNKSVIATSNEMVSIHDFVRLAPNSYEPPLPTMDNTDLNDKVL